MTSRSLQGFCGGNRSYLDGGEELGGGCLSHGFLKAERGQQGGLGRNQELLRIALLLALRAEKAAG